MEHHYRSGRAHGHHSESSHAHHLYNHHDHGRSHKHSPLAHPDSEVRSVKDDSPQSLIFNNSDIYKSVSSPNSTSETDLKLKRVGQTLAIYADEVATRLGTIGDCAHGPRLSLERLGLKFSPAIATEQGKAIKNSGMFDEVARGQVRAGDYGVRDWSPGVIRAHNGINKGDAFIVTHVGNGGALYGANDHHLQVPEDGDRYRNMKFYRVNERLLRLLESTSSSNV